MHGYAGRVLELDLTQHETTVELMDNNTMTNYVGGKGFGAEFLNEKADLQKDPLHASNLLILAIGPVNGLALSGAAKFCAVFKSPLTGIWGESQCGGYFAPQMKHAGYDVIIIRGKSEKPVYFLVDDDNVEVKRADHLWGKDTFETEDIIKKENGQCFQVLSIGPAGENLVRFACVSHDKGRELGRCGAGAVMGSKRLKAVAVHGTNIASVFDPYKLRDFTTELNLRIKERLRSLREYGTPNMISITNETGSLPTRNWTEGQFEGVENIGAEAIKKAIMKSSKACFACAVACRKISKVENGFYAGTEVEGPEYETLYALGSLCGNDDLGSIVKANEICDRLGMDTISAGNALAFAMECYERGLITTEDTNDLKLNFGNHTSMIDMLRRIAYRDGLGDILAEGVKRASRMIGRGSSKFSIHVKGLEPSGYDPRALKGMALSYAVSCRGACHLRHMAHRPNLTGAHPFGGEKVDRLSYEGQAQLVVEQEDFYTLVDSMVLCKFLCLPAIGPVGWEEMTNLFNIVTGKRFERKDLVERARRISNLIRHVNTRMGVNRKADSLPTRFTKDPLKNGASIGETVNGQRFGEMLSAYYSLKGWSRDGRPVGQKRKKR